MAYQVKRSIMTIVTILVGLGVYGGIMLTNLSDPLTIYEYGMYVLLAIPVLVVTQIIGKIIFDIFNRTADKNEEAKKMDEFDKIIEYKSVRNFSFVVLTGFFTAMLLMWVSTLLASFLTLFLTLFVAGIALQISYIIYYTKGV